MLTVIQTAAIALCSGVVSAFATNLFKADFDRRARREEWQRAQQRWVLDKSARNAEEILTTLESVSKGLLQLLSVTYGHHRQLVEDERVGVDYVEKSLNPLFARVSEAQQKRFAWFNYEARRLSGWFVDDEKVYEELQELGRRVDASYEELYISLGLIAYMREQRHEYSDEEHYKKSVQGNMSSFSATGNRTTTLTNDIAQYQRELVRRLRDLGSDQEDGDDQQHGPLVRAALWLERLLRR